MPSPEATQDLYLLLQRLQLVLVAAGRRAWSQMRDDFDPSWAAVAPSLVRVTSAAQLAAARAATEYVPALLAETGQPDRPAARVRPESFAARASDGRSLAGLLQGAVVTAKRATQSTIVRDGDSTTLIPGAGVEEALLGGQKWLEQALASAVTDAARDATQAEIIVRQTLGYVKMPNPPCCPRCAVLAGEWYRWNTINERHPGCDCTLIPAAENVAGDYRTDPAELVRRGLVTDLSSNQRERLDEGANLNKVLNESRDRWRQRLAADRRGAKKGWGSPETAPPTATVHDFMAHLTSRVDAITAMRSAGIAS